MKEDKIKIIGKLENIKNKNSITMDKLEMILSELERNQKELLQILMGLKSKVKKDEEEK